MQTMEVNSCSNHGQGWSWVDWCRDDRCQHNSHIQGAYSALCDVVETIRGEGNATWTPGQYAPDIYIVKFPDGRRAAVVNGEMGFPDDVVVGFKQIKKLRAVHAARMEQIKSFWAEEAKKEREQLDSSCF